MKNLIKYILLASITLFTSSCDPDNEDDFPAFQNPVDFETNINSNTFFVSEIYAEDGLDLDLDGVKNEFVIQEELRNNRNIENGCFSHQITFVNSTYVVDSKISAQYLEACQTGQEEIGTVKLIQGTFVEFTGGLDVILKHLNYSNMKMVLYKSVNSAIVLTISYTDNQEENQVVKLILRNIDFQTEMDYREYIRQLVN